MKNLLSILILCGIFFFNSCSNPNQNQNVVTDQSDTGVLIASNDQNLIVDTPSEIVMEDKKVNQTQHIEPPNNSEDQRPKKKDITTPVLKNASQKTENRAIQSNKTLKPQDTIDKSESETRSSTTKHEPPTSNSKLQTPNSEEPPFNHDKWDQLLRKYVSTSGKVNYKGLKSEKAELDAYLKYLDQNPIQDNWSKAKKMAYWINAYNAFTIKMIVDNYPVSSITKLHGGKPWDYKWIKLGGQTYNLNNIENDILRPKYKDARIHFAVNCAAQSCPPILNQAWTESNLNQMLEKQAKAFINNPKFNTLKSNEIEISKIFEWYAADFGIVVDYLNKYSNTKIDKNAKLKFKEYDWALNE